MYCADPLNGEKTPRQINGIASNKVNVRGLPPLYLNEVTPIPLTREIINKNKSAWMNRVYLYTYGRENPEQTKWVLCIGNEYLSLDIRIIHLVHELQHVIWVLGMDDNLRL